MFMYNSKIISIFQTFSKTEKIGLRRWVNSSMHNQRKDVIELIDYLLSRRKITETSVKRVRVYKQLYPSKKYDLYQLNHVLSMTTKLMEDYIKFLMSKKSPFKDEILLNLYYKRRNIPHLANKALLRAEINLEKGVYKNEQYYYDSFSLELALFDLMGTEQRRQNTNLEDIFNNLAVFTMIATLRNACIALSHKNLFKTNYYIPLLDAILEEAAKEMYADNTVVRCYYHSYMALAFPDEEEHFRKLMHLLLNHKIPLPIEEQKYVCLLAINYCIKRLNTGEEAYVKQVLDIYKFGLEHQIWIENGQLSHTTFKNIATAALRLKEYEWTNHFIDEYGPKLSDFHEVVYTNYIKAKLLFELKDFAGAQDLLINTVPNDLFIGLAIKTLFLKVYFMLKEYTLLESHLDSFTVFLNRKKVLAYHKKIYGNIILITRKIVFTNLDDKDKKAKLRELILTMNPLTERPWLLAQVE